MISYYYDFIMNRVKYEPNDETQTFLNNVFQLYENVLESSVSIYLLHILFALSNN